MAIQLQLRRGTAEENKMLVGGEGELTYASDTQQLFIHDGKSMGGVQ